MKTPDLSVRLLLILISLLTATSALAQPDDGTASAQALTVFLDCNYCDRDYIRREITFVNYVRDRTQAQLHLLTSNQRTGSGREWTLNFIGQDQFAGIDDTLTYVSSDTDTDDQRREGFVETIKLGLIRYVAHTPLADDLNISYDAPDDAQEKEEHDPWNNWVFEVGASGSGFIEETRDSYRINGDLGADRVTEEWKFRFSAGGGYSEENFDIDDMTITSTNRSGSARALLVKSLGDHWSVGGFTRVSTSSFNNTALSTSLSPAIEYNVFPYEDSSKRSLRIGYYVNLRNFEYDEVTIFDKTSETLLHHELEIELSFRQPWGDAHASFEASNYLTDFKESRVDLYRWDFWGWVSVRVATGLSVFVNGGISRISDQIFLPKEDASDEDILLGNVRLPTSYSYNFRLGFNYTFGSIYNNVVNPRFGS